MKLKKEKEEQMKESANTAGGDKDGVWMAMANSFGDKVTDSDDELTASSTLWKRHIPSLQNRLPSSDRHIKTAPYKT